LKTTVTANRYDIIGEQASTHAANLKQHCTIIINILFVQKKCTIIHKAKSKSKLNSAMQQVYENSKKTKMTKRLS